MFFREASLAQRVFLQKRAAARWGVVQPVGHLTVNAHETILQPSARSGRTAQVGSVYAAHNRLASRIVTHWSALLIKLN